MDIMGGNFSRNSQISIIIYPNEQEVFQEEECLGTIHILRDHFSAPYLAGVLGVPQHPRILGVHKRGKAWFLSLAITTNTPGFEKLCI